MYDFLKYFNNDIVFFEATLQNGAPYIADSKRNHESLFYVTEGKLLHENAQKRTVISEGQIGYIAKGFVDKSGAFECEKVSYIAVNFAFGEIRENFVSDLPFSTLASENKRGYPYKILFERALREFESKSPSTELIVGALLMQILGYLHNEVVLEQTSHARIKKIEESVDYFKANIFNAGVTVKELADISDMHEKSYRRAFIQIFGIAPYEFMQNFRIERAQILLMNTPMSISSIAELCGFSDVYSFSHAFKRHIGVSPRNFRKR